ncbi:MAG: cation diffusion facilitator family transporter [Defluviitaleaceae bacterium]|nr:cation diffusion facilitator family transporter [Defluviitaleaceae bacterium]
MKKTNEQLAVRASFITISFDIVLTIFKLFAGIIGNSTAMIADAAHSFSDMYTTIIVMIGVKMSNKKADKDHHYGHERFECVAAIILSVVLVFTGAGIGWSGLSQIIAMDFEEIVVPGIIALIAALTNIVVKGIMYIYKRGVAKKINSGALMADAWHHLSDSLSSIGSFLGILGARMGFPILDPIAAVVICLFIFKVALDIFRDAISKMTDRACDEETETKIRTTILSHEHVTGIDLLRTRLFGDRIYVEAEISMDPNMSLHEAHEVAHQVHDTIESEFEKVKHCSIHINPTKPIDVIDE